MISIKGLHKFFNKGKSNEIHVINGIDLQLPEKGMVAIFGKSGCGKTTLLNVIGGLDSFADGEITVEGKSICKNTDDIRNGYIGYIFQNYNLCRTETCFDNVAAALRLCGMTDGEEIKRRVDAALRNVGMENYAKRSPDTLSGGQQQRIAIARAIVKNPRIILADEPTGNLDEANTVMIMDLLKSISKEHLVLLVTHEANLVDYYCDTVIELSDGKVVNVKNNALANGFAARDKNDIYLGELNRRELSDENAFIEYYGDTPPSKVNIKIINSGGKIYVQIGTDKVHILDETSEIKLREGVYKELNSAENKETQNLDMSALPPVQATKTGRLFSFKSSLKSAYSSNFGEKNKKGKAFLKRFMALFSAVIVFISAIFGTAFKDMAEADGAYNHNTFYLYTPDAKTSEKLIGALGKSDSGIDFIRLIGGYPQGDAYVGFKAGSFETFSQFDLSSLFGTNAVILDASLAKNLKVIEGRTDNTAEDELIITTRVADALLKKSPLGYIKDRSDLIGLVMITNTQGRKAPRIAGIVESDETAVYMNELALARQVHNAVGTSETLLASDYGISLKEGEILLAIKTREEKTTYPVLNERIKIQGLDLKVTEAKECIYDYTLWLEENNIQKYDEYNYFLSLIKKSYPEISEGSEEFYNLYNTLRNEKIFEYYDYFYSETEGFYRDIFFFDPYYFELWLYLEKNVEEARFAHLPENYYKAFEYKKLYGKYPTESELTAIYDTLGNFYENIEDYRNLYENEFSQEVNMPGFNSINDSVYLVSDADFISLSKQIGDTHPTAKGMERLEYYYDGKSDEPIILSNSVYTLIHSNSPEKTEAWINENFPDLTLSVNNRSPLISPTDIYNELIQSKSKKIVTNLIAMIAIIAVTSVCMYFIMHASIMNRIKEIGIYRAIGVSRKNLIFKFFIEAALLATLTVFVGYLVSSGLLFVFLRGSSLITEILYYPVWLALSVLGIVYSITLFFGTLPIILMLRKTPSQILAKYDI